MRHASRAAEQDGLGEFRESGAALALGDVARVVRQLGLEAPDAGEILVNGESIMTPEIAAKYRMALEWCAHAWGAAWGRGGQGRVAFHQAGYFLYP